MTPHPEDAMTRERALERIAREADELANGARFDGNKRTEREFRRLGKIALAALASALKTGPNK